MILQNTNIVGIHDVYISANLSLNIESITPKFEAHVNVSGSLDMLGPNQTNMVTYKLQVPSALPFPLRFNETFYDPSSEKV